MNNNRKLLFFDIDGTLLTAYPWSIPESTRKALEAARKTAICSSSTPDAPTQ